MTNLRLNYIFLNIDAFLDDRGWPYGNTIIVIAFG
jgi:hypothetical protein